MAILPASFCIMLAGCESVKPPSTVAMVDVARYTGRWYEIARLPMPFQKKDEPAMAEYALAPNGTLSVHNTATRPDGSQHDIRGYATILNPPENTKLAVRFTTWFAPLIPIPKEGNYWILYVDDKYNEAIVGTPDRRYLWILSRSPKIPVQNLQALMERAAKSGFELTNLIHDPQR